jgi:galactose-1-phosphate uridylyltransferase
MPLFRDPSMPEKLPRHLLKALLQANDLGDLSPEQIVDLFRHEPGIGSYLPDGQFVTDPRNGDRILFNAARARRPHDNRPRESLSGNTDQECIICQGQTTGIVDLAELSQGQTFINKNLYPVLFPFPGESLAAPGAAVVEDGRGTIRGLHFLQWTSSHHDKDWHNMPAGDRLVVMERLAALEKRLIDDSARLLHPASAPPGDSSPAGYVLITKNFGRLVGGSLAHGHQQVALSSVMPRRFADNQRFERTHGVTFSAYLARVNPPELTIKDYGQAVLMVPYFMRRPYDMILLLKESGRRYLHHLNQGELQAVADGWRDAIRLMLAIMPALGRETAYTVLTNSGPGAGLYFEFQPYTQEFGGFEQLGLLVCQASPAEAAEHIKQLLATA